MSSTNKTPSLQLNNWIGTDIPRREDFNRDNSIIDDIISRHNSDEDIHITADERLQWNSPYYIGTYYGTGAATNKITLSCDFVPSFIIVFAMGYPPSVCDFKNSANYHYFGIATKNTETPGVVLDGKVMTVTQSATSIFGNEYRSYNRTGVSYIYIAFR